MMTAARYHFPYDSNHHSYYLYWSEISGPKYREKWRLWESKVMSRSLQTGVRMYPRKQPFSRYIRLLLGISCFSTSFRPTQPLRTHQVANFTAWLH